MTKTLLDATRPSALKFKVSFHTKDIMTKRFTKLSSLFKKIKNKATGLFRKKEGFEENTNFSNDPLDDFLEKNESEVSEPNKLESPPFPELPSDSIQDEQSDVLEKEIGQTGASDFLEDTAHYDLPEELSSDTFETSEPSGPSKIKSYLSSLKNKTKTLKGQGSSNQSLNFKGKVTNFLSQFRWDQYYTHLFLPQNRPKVHRIYLFSISLSCSFFIGRMISGLLTPSPTGKIITKKENLSLNNTKNLRSKLLAIRNNDLFQAPEKTDSPVIDKKPVKSDYVEPKVCNNASKKSSLGLKLINTVILQDSVKSLASVQVRGKESYLRVGDEIPNMIQVGRINAKKLIFKNLKNRQCEFVENVKRTKLPKKSLKIIKEPKQIKKILEENKIKGITQNGNTFKIKKDVRQKMLENISEVLTQARAVQIKNPDGSFSFRMQEVVPGSIYSQLDIKDDDLITGINGKPITNIAELMNLFGQMDKIDHFELSRTRDGIEQNLEYDFE